MIARFQHKGLKLFYDKGNASKLQPQHVTKIRLILTRLDAATSPGDMNVPGYGLPAFGRPGGFLGRKGRQEFPDRFPV